MSDGFFNMTIEEAGEEILNGKAWVICNRCHGSGQYGVPFTSVDALHKTSQSRRWTQCTVCTGRGHLKNITYHHAARMLNLSIPPAPSKTSRATKL